MENPIKMDDLGGTPIFGNTHMKQLLVGGFSPTHLKKYAQVKLDHFPK